ncbi:MAG: MEDS domain-containing protein [Candidatus Magnetominusculus sp. LBB02]|nr:MEDS domain-containing protein [Candidatus Magnetominusculus sp. LBB02]
MEQNYKADYGFVPDKYPSGTHMCHIYGSSEERRQVMSKFVESGLLAREKVIYLAEVATEAEIGGYLEDLGLDVSEHIKSGQLFIDTAMKGYCPDGRFDAERMIEAWRSFYKKADEDGYTALRGTGEPLWIGEKVPGVESWFKYESFLNNLLVDYPLSGVICQYNASKYDGATLYEVLKVHPLMIVKGQILYNPLYVPTDEYLAKH